MGKTPSIKYETPAPDSPVGESRRDKETPKDPAKAGPTGQGERVKISPIFLLAPPAPLLLSNTSGSNPQDYSGFFKTLFILAGFFLLREFKKVAGKIS